MSVTNKIMYESLSKKWTLKLCIPLGILQLKYSIFFFKNKLANI